MNPRERRRGILYDEPHTAEDLDILWREYRTGKQYACFGTICEAMASFNMTMEQYSRFISAKEWEPPQGSGYWLVAVERPGSWAERELY